MPVATQTIPTHFGDAVIVPMPHGCDVMIVCVLGRSGLRPVRVSLPHQLYAADIANLLIDGDERVVCIPYRSSDAVDVRLEQAAAV